MSGPGEQENLWGYRKRLRFVERALAEAYPRRAAGSLRVLDVGCGNGSELALPLARRGFQVTGLDVDAPSVEHANRLATDLPNARFACLDVTELKSEPFDVVILSEVLEHVTDPRSLLASSVRHLAADGVGIVTVPNGYGEFELDSRLFRLLRLQRVVDRLAKNGREVAAATDNHASGHVQFFTRRRLRQLFAECSLAVFREGAASFMAGPLVGHTLARSRRFIEWNSRVTDKLPPALASGWYFALRRTRGEASTGAPV
ncbi:MAG TPA: methyltransferase domain-containing protein [Pyrinomonadaceae bacterium]|nr:methyltransferase domain-containing protein [Pyrinomonadaceae bacterium]